MAEGIIRALEAKPGSGTNDAVFHGQLHLGAGAERQAHRWGTHGGDCTRHIPERAAGRGAPSTAVLLTPTMKGEAWTKPNSSLGQDGNGGSNAGLAPVKPVAAKCGFQYCQKGLLGRLLWGRSMMAIRDWHEGSWYYSQISLLCHCSVLHHWYTLWSTAFMHQQWLWEQLSHWWL